MATRRFWDWRRPVLQHAVSTLVSQSPRFDWSDTLILVPTSEAGRRLRRALAEAADGEGRAATIPHVWAPERVLRHPRAATRMELELAWQRVLEGPMVRGLKALFPTLPERVDWGWRREMALMLIELQQIAGAGGLRFSDIAATANLAEPKRWADLSVLEQALDRELEGLDRLEPERAKRSVAEDAMLPDGIRRVWVMAAPDLPPLITAWLDQLPPDYVTVCIHAPEELAEQFDGWGRPGEAFWGADVVEDLGVATSSVHVENDVGGQVERLTALLRESVTRGRRTAVGICDAEVIPTAQERLQGEEIETFEPGGYPATHEGMFEILSRTTELVRRGDWRTFCEMIRLPEVREHWSGSRHNGALRAADAFSVECLPGSLEQALPLLEGWSHDEAPRLLRAARAAQRMIRSFQQLPLSDAAREWLLGLEGERAYDSANAADQQRLTLSTRWLELLEEVDTNLARLGLRPERAEVLDLALAHLGKLRLGSPRGEVDLVLQGWLELLWEDAPGLIVAGFSEEQVPGILSSHPFLPNSFRRRLGLPSQESRFSRDAYLLAALQAQRQSGGSLDLVCGQWSKGGEVRRISRLLLVAKPAELGGRVAALLPEDQEAREEDPPRSLVWQLKSSQPFRPLTSISPTRLRDYLDCPYRYHLRHGMRMRTLETGVREMNALGFGNLVHDALQQLAEDPDARASTDENRIATFLEEAVRRAARRQFGDQPAPLVRLQVESAQQRLRYLAVAEAAERAAGWEILEAEYPLMTDDRPSPLLLAGIPLRGTVDRIERHRDTGVLRIVDFKTSDRGEAPLEAHCSQPKAVAEQDQWKTSRIAGSTWLWKSLQLPLYAAALNRAGTFGNVRKVAYGLLPKNVQGSQISEWTDFGGEWEEAALKVAETAVERIQEGHFWPPTAKPMSREFDAILLGDPLQSASQPLSSE